MTGCAVSIVRPSSCWSESRDLSNRSRVAPAISTTIDLFLPSAAVASASSPRHAHSVYFHPKQLLIFGGWVIGGRIWHAPLDGVSYSGMVGGLIERRSRLHVAAINDVWRLRRRCRRRASRWESRASHDSEQARTQRNNKTLVSALWSGSPRWTNYRQFVARLHWTQRKRYS